jgi:hypothetical protein
MLDTICADNPQYEWKVSGGVIDILPKDMDKDYLIDLRYRIVNFKRRHVPFNFALAYLFKEQRLPLSRRAFRASGAIAHWEPMDFACRSVTILECINLMARQSRTFWQIIYRHDEKAFDVGHGQGLSPRE